MSITTDVKESLKRLADIKKDALKSVKSTAVPESPEDMFQYEAGHPDYNHKRYFLFHGKCFEDGSKELRTKYSYVFQKTGHFAKSDTLRAGAKCQHCNQQLDAKQAAKRQAEQATKLATKAKAYTTWVKRQMLLGKDVSCRCESIGRQCPNKGRSLSE